MKPAINALDRNLFTKRLLWPLGWTSHGPAMRVPLGYLPLPNPGIAGKIARRTRRGYRR